MMLVNLIDLVFYAAQGLMLAHIILSWMRLSPSRPNWIYRPVAVWIDDAGDALLRPFRVIFDRLGISRATGGIDFSPILAFIVVRFLHGLAIRAAIGL
jgi:uncharacterized protein YggT (Ycf19 family)